MRLGPGRGHSREVPPDVSAAEEACDQRSMPQDVTSSSADAEGSICQKRSCLSSNGRSPRDSPLHGTSDRAAGRNSTYKLERPGGGFTPAMPRPRGRDGLERAKDRGRRRSEQRALDLACIPGNGGDGARALVIGRDRAGLGCRVVPGQPRAMAASRPRRCLDRLEPGAGGRVGTLGGAETLRMHRPGWVAAGALAGRPGGGMALGAGDRVRAGAPRLRPATARRRGGPPCGAGAGHSCTPCGCKPCR
ncbi:MAG: hypothetical protein KatS3mg108_0679 [Isosphaeraceae bacterium]|jgi:hypothetical protein|nr:MAG: hypothetical protein KatS3mg108_0679 [Isosphaeraceae bacterium]